MVVAGELPETSLQVQVPVEAQCAVAPKRAAELIGHCLSHAFRAACGSCDEAMTCGDLLVVQQVGAAVVSNPGPIRTECQVKVHKRTSRDYRKHACKLTKKEKKIVIGSVFNYL